jgi:hypothetical protein
MNTRQAKSSAQNPSTMSTIQPMNFRSIMARLSNQQKLSWAHQSSELRAPRGSTRRDTPGSALADVYESATG